MLSLSILNYVQYWQYRLCVCVCVCVCVCTLSHSVMSDSETPWTLSCQSSLSVEFSRQECISYFRGFSWPRDWTRVSCLLPCKADSLPLHPIGSQLLYISSVQSLSHVRLFVTTWAAAHQASLLHIKGYKYIASEQLHGNVDQCAI